MRPVSLFLILLFALSLGICGCVTVQQQPFEVKSLEPSAALRFSDIPVPSGFKILPKESFILESGGVRAGILKYTGKADAQSVVLFYRNQMPIYNWALLNVLEYGDHMLNFERENESCVITIKPAGGRAELVVSLAPKSPLPGRNLLCLRPAQRKPKRFLSSKRKNSKILLDKISQICY
jgi:hypothetical protein